MSRSIVRLLMCLALCCAIAALASVVTTPEIPTWYAELDKPSWTPPDWAFPVAWSILYVLIAVALWRLWEQPSSPARGHALHRAVEAVANPRHGDDAALAFAAQRLAQLADGGGQHVVHGNPPGPGLFEQFFLGHHLAGMAQQ